MQYNIWLFNGSKAYMEVLWIQTSALYYLKALITQSKQKHSNFRLWGLHQPNALYTNWQKYLWLWRLA